MSETSALLLLTVLGGYLAIGFVFSIAFVCFGLARVDNAAAGASIGFRFLILPGIALFWPLLASRWLHGTGIPPDERSAHICESREGRL